MKISASLIIKIRKIALNISWFIAIILYFISWPLIFIVDGIWISFVFIGLMGYIIAFTPSVMFNYLEKYE